MALRKMQSRYAGKCSRCGSRFAAGDVIFWSRETKAVCVKCATPELPLKPPVVPPKPPKRAEEGYDTFAVEWSDVKAVTLAALKSESLSHWFTKRKNVDGANEHIRIGSDHWHGFTEGQLQRWLEHGYETSAIANLSEFNPPIRDKRRLRFVEEGDEFHFDIAASGDEKYMSEWSKRQSIPGLSIEVEISFSAYTSPTVVNAYNAWVCRAMYSLESVGIDTEISMVNTVGGRLFNEAMAIKAKTRVVVKRENETLDFVSFSPMLGPAALRSFGFTAQTMHAEARGYTISSGHGTPYHRHSDFAIEYDRENRKLLIFSHSDASFPEERMTRDLIAALREVMQEN